MHRTRAVREIRRNVMLEAVFADVTQQRLQFGNFHHARAAECFERVRGEFAFADVAANASA